MDKPRLVSVVLDTKPNVPRTCCKTQISRRKLNHSGLLIHESLPDMNFCPWCGVRIAEPKPSGETS